MDWLSSDLYGAYREWMAVAEDERMYRVVADVSRAAELSAQRLGGMGDRWRHTQAVAARASSASPAVAPNDRDLLVAAAWLHDIGYADSVADTGLHPLDGAEYLTRRPGLNRPSQGHDHPTLTQPCVGYRAGGKVRQSR